MLVPLPSALAVAIRASSLLAVVWAAGCAPEREQVVANHLLTPDDQGAVVEWDGGDRDQALAAMREALAGTPSERPTPAADGVRWSDVPAAAYWGAIAAEMAVVSSESGDRVMRFTLVTVRDEPATLVVERVDEPDRIRATATVGSLGQLADEARRLEHEFRVSLEGFGRKPGFGR
jgi:hypothetical protein